MKRTLTLLLMLGIIWNFLTGCMKERVYTGKDLPYLPVENWAMLEKEGDSWGRYYRKGEEIYWQGKVDQKVENIDFPTFAVNARYTDFAKDRNRYYYFGVPLKVDFATMQLLGKAHSKDENGVYYGVHQLPGADPENFEVVDRIVEGQTPYGKDKNGVYYQWMKIQGADPKQFDFGSDKGQGPFEEHQDIMIGR